MAFRVRKLFGTFEKRAPGPGCLEGVQMFFRCFCSVQFKIIETQNRRPNFTTKFKTQIKILNLNRALNNPAEELRF